MAGPYQRSYDTRLARWRARQRFARLWKRQLRLEKQLRLAVGTSEEEPLRAQIQAVNLQRAMLAEDLGGGYPAAHEMGLMGPV